MCCTLLNSHLHLHLLSFNRKALGVFTQVSTEIKEISLFPIMSYVPNVVADCSFSFLFFFFSLDI